MENDWIPFIISIKTAVTATFITFFLGIFTAKNINKINPKYRGIMDTVFTLPMILPPTVIGFFLLIIFGRRGFLGSMLYSLGINVIFSWEATVIAAVVVSFPLMYSTAKGAFEQIDENIINAARTMGVSENKIFWRIIIPLAWPGIAAGTVLSFARSLGEFGATLMIAGNIPGRTQTIPLAIYFTAEGGDFRGALNWVLVICAISFFTMVAMNFWREYQKKLGKNRRISS